MDESMLPNNVSSLGIAELLIVGYPNDYYGLKTKYNLSNRDAYIQTQEAIYNVIEGNFEHKNSEYEDFNNYYNSLIDSFLSPQIANAKSSVDLFQWIKGTGQPITDNRNYQYLVGISNFTKNINLEVTMKSKKKNIIDETVTFSVEKKWEGKKDDSAIINLYANGIMKEEIILNLDNEWKHTFENLSKYDALTGEEIEYTIKEIDVEGYTSKITGDIKSGFVVTNTYKNEVDEGPKDEVDGGSNEGPKDEVDGGSNEDPKDEVDGGSNEGPKDEVDGGSNEGPKNNIDPKYGEINNKMSISVEKKWIGKKDKSANINLFENGKKILSVNLNEENNWKYLFENLYKNREYTITEDYIKGYITKIKGDSKNGFIVTNIYINDNKVEKLNNDNTYNNTSKNNLQLYNVNYNYNDKNHSIKSDDTQEKLFEIINKDYNEKLNTEKVPETGDKTNIIFYSIVSLLSILILRKRIN